MLQAYASIHPTRIVVFFQTDNRNYSSRITNPFTESKQVARNDLLSRKARNNLNLAINALIYTAKWKRCYQISTKKYFRFKVNFITLTLPAATSLTDSVISRKILGEFLRKWHKRNPSLLYVWKAECQDNGNLHFHLTTNCYIHYEKLRAYWVKQCAKEGIINNKVGLAANCTDIHSVKNIRNLAAYLTAYVCKKDLYKACLKRYFRLYKKKLYNLKEPVFQLPRNYYQNLKRRPTCRLWDASKPLLNSAEIISLTSDPREVEIDDLGKWLAPSFKDDYICCYALDEKTREKLPTTMSGWINHFNQGLKVNAEEEKRYYQI